MIPIIAGLLLLWLGSTLMREFVRANPAALARRVKQGGGAVALVAAVLMLLRGEIGVAIGLAGVGFWLANGKAAPDWTAFGRGWRGRSPSSRRVTRVRSGLIVMELDHDTGAMSGSVTVGPLAGRGLDSIELAEIVGLHRLCLSTDPEGARLLEAYLDRRAPRWRAADHNQRDTGAGEGASARRDRPGAMTEDEAYQLLGLAKGARREEIVRAHRTLMKKFHPDHGGSTDMAARVNEAKDVLMRRHL